MWTLKQTEEKQRSCKFSLYGKIRGLNNIDCKTIGQKNRLPKWPGNTASVNKQNHEEIKNNNNKKIQVQFLTRKVTEDACCTTHLINILDFLIHGIMTSFLKCAEPKMRE